eukprot:1628333-Rhodomonas_salina.1
MCYERVFYEDMSLKSLRSNVPSPLSPYALPTSCPTAFARACPTVLDPNNAHPGQVQLAPFRLRRDRAGTETGYWDVIQGVLGRDLDVTSVWRQLKRFTVQLEAGEEARGSGEKCGFLSSNRGGRCLPGLVPTSVVVRHCAAKANSAKCVARTSGVRVVRACFCFLGRSRGHDPSACCLAMSGPHVGGLTCLQAVKSRVLLDGECEFPRINDR